ncbi:hypothetical protein ACH5RR_008826 [Cinchona calisaya]|uniref:Uncharacterized protein n=1 Tax=Cinchona calisaya TaxID=153742 RepID=A0ABD3AE83_9GENT
MNPNMKEDSSGLTPSNKSLILFVVPKVVEEGSNMQQSKKPSGEAMVIPVSPNAQQSHHGNAQQCLVVASQEVNDVPTGKKLTAIDSHAFVDASQVEKVNLAPSCNLVPGISYSKNMEVNSSFLELS